MRELTRIREERGLSQQTLADASGVNKATINQIERGRRSPNARTLEKLAAALGVEMGDFFPLAQSPLPLDEIAREWGWKQAPPEAISEEQRTLLKREDAKAAKRDAAGEKPEAFFAGDTGQVIRVHPALLFITLTELDRLSKENQSLRSRLEEVGAA
jgi:transcriptional regulator with XRE-family HTH domain